jgi:hypothetical protein
LHRLALRAIPEDPGIGRDFENNLGGDFGGAKNLAIGRLDLGLSSLALRIKGTRVKDLIRSQDLLVLQSAEDGQVDWISVFSP